MSRSQHLHDKGEGARLGLQNLVAFDKDDEETGATFSSVVIKELRRSLENVKSRPINGFFAPKWKMAKHFVWNTSLGTFLAVFFSLWAILLIGVAGMMALEGWTFIQALYFSVFSMTTTGYGDFAPTNDASSWFCVFWLPLNILYLAIYLSSVGHYWVKLCDWNVRRVSKNLRAKEEADATSEQASDDNNNNAVDAGAVATIGSKETRDDHQTGSLRRSRIRKFGNKSSEGNNTDHNIVIGMQSILRAIHNQIDAGEVLDWQQVSDNLMDSKVASLDDEEAGKLRDMGNGRNIPLALRVLVQERVANIIAYEISGSEFRAEVKEEKTLVVTMRDFKEILEEWKIPPATVKAFRQVVFESLFYVGENTMLKRGVNSFFDLNPIELNKLFTPFMLAMTDATMMEGWLASTERRAKRWRRSADGVDTANQIGGALANNGPRYIVEERIDDFFPVNQGNAVLITQR